MLGLNGGEHLVTLAVRDSDGFWSVSVNRTLAVWSPPTVTALCPEDGIVGDELHFSANASDSDGQVILYEWDFQSPTGVLLKVDDAEYYLVFDRGALAAGETLLVLGAAGGVGLAILMLQSAVSDSPDGSFSTARYRPPAASGKRGANVSSLPARV